MCVHVPVCDVALTCVRMLSPYASLDLPHMWPLQEALEHFVACKRDIRMDSKIRNVALRMWLDSCVVSKDPSLEEAVST